ncbi:hypothetical protein SAMN04488096_10465 [Mesonia phycicola]|uniref:Uncharacterized protein n=1 Tax=Mesonia phycicola TaxID=579105 RepID=A0A1M6DLF8_9FLAO|nr:hypothetical protein [Mesonia phycicola]SHI74144.1 hypothetical protein SAMN04488096_10465 [Mesonia phycicola]
MARRKDVKYTIYKIFRKHSVLMSYHYFDNHQKPITTIEITTAMYTDE